MRGIIYLDFEKSLQNEYIFSSSLGEFDYEFLINVDRNEPFKDALADKERVRQGIEEWISYNEDFADPIDEKLGNLIKSREGQEETLLQNCEYIYINGSLEEKVHYIEDNPEIKEKKIVIKSNYNVGREYFNLIESLFKEYADRLCFQLNENKRCISLDIYKKTVKRIDEIVDEIRTFDFSPLEAIMYAYDIVRSRVYKKSDEESEFASTDLSSILFGDFIVCEGYTTYLKAILQKLGIKCRAYELHSVDDVYLGHSRLVVFLDDAKYDVHGVYYFDATWDSKEKKDDCRFLNTYRHFALTKTQCDSELKRVRYIDVTFGNFGIEAVLDFIDECREVGFENATPETVRSINAVSRFIYDRNLLPNPRYIDNEIVSSRIRSAVDYDEVERRLDEMIDLMATPITADVFLKVLANVRKMEYYRNPNSFPYDVDTFYRIFKNSKWSFTDEDCDFVSKILFGVSYKKSDETKKLAGFLREEDIDRTIGEVRVTRTLKTVLEKEKTMSLNRIEKR